MDRNHSTLEGTGKGRFGRIAVGKLAVDVDLLEGIKELAQREGIRTGVILSAVGALKKALFRNLKVMPLDYKVDDRHRLYLELDQPMELVSLTGWIATGENDAVEVHAHFSASTVIEEQVVTLGGHLIPGVITSIKVVVVIGSIDDSGIKAAIDPKTNQVDVTFQGVHE
jgi:predicted DNA-binding protein with PD1-like motif